jgi:hypothetical protein
MIVGESAASSSATESARTSFIAGPILHGGKLRT